MPRVADYPSRSVWEEAAWHALITYFATLQKPKDIDAMLRILITSHERSLFMRRMTAINRILEKKTYQEIGEELFLTAQTVSTIKKALRSEHYRSYHERSKTERKKRIYSPIKSSPFKKDPSLRTRRTKYGTIKIRA